MKYAGVFTVRSERMSLGIGDYRIWVILFYYIWFWIYIWIFSLFYIFNNFTKKSKF
jgi:hypothetical protein